MELEFQKKQLDFLKPVLREVQNQELTQELRLGDGMPDVKRVIGSWCQCVIRGKEWHRDSILCSGGVMVWVLYEPEGEDAVRTINAWLPFQQRWELPPDTPEGEIRISCLPRFLDARNVSPRKIMMRSGVSCLGEAYVRDSLEMAVPEKKDPDVEMRLEEYTLDLGRKVGEKIFLVDEALPVSESAPAVQQIISCMLDPVLLDNRVVTDKLVFRGVGKGTLLYMTEDGQVHTTSFEPGFSQYTELGEAFGTDARADIRMAVTSLEPELEENGTVRIKCGLLAQYLIREPERVQVLEDVYSPLREVQANRQLPELPVMEKKITGNAPVEVKLPGEAMRIVEERVLPDFPQQHFRGDDGEVSCSGNLQVLYYDSSNQLQQAVSRWEGSASVNAGGMGVPMLCPQPCQLHAEISSDGMTLKGELQVEGLLMNTRQIPMITQVELGKPLEKDPQRPSLILQRAGQQGLWELAKGSGSTVEAIRRANGLEGECQPGQLLLIPIP